MCHLVYPILIQFLYCTALNDPNIALHVGWTHYTMPAFWLDSVRSASGVLQVSLRDERQNTGLGGNVAPEEVVLRANPIPAAG